MDNDALPVSAPGQSFYKAKTLAAAGGISTTLLRAWERRYQFFSPSRSAGQHRLYSEEDLTFIRRVRRLLDTGLSIGEVAALGRSHLLAGETPQRLAPTGSAPYWEILDSKTRADLLALAPAQLRCRRSARFGGEGLGINLRLLDPADLNTVFRLYRLVKGVYELWNYLELRLVPDLLLEGLRALGSTELLAQVGTLGAATATTDPLIQASLRDSRLGALPYLLRLSQLALKGVLTQPQFQLLVVLARDHAKMMRNAFLELDEPLRSADQTLKAHDLPAVLNKLGALRCLDYPVSISSDFEGSITCRCLEASALDRVLYQYLQAKTTLRLGVAQVNKSTLRWAFESDFQPDSLTLSVLAKAMGVSEEESLGLGYVGTAQGWSWFHWPIYQIAPGVPSCHCDPFLSSL